MLCFTTRFTSTLVFIVTVIHTEATECSLKLASRTFGQAEVCDRRTLDSLFQP